MKSSHLYLTLLSVSITLAGVFLKNAEHQRNMDRMNDPEYKKQVQEMAKLFLKNDSSGVFSRFRLQVNVVRLRYDQNSIPRNLNEFLTPKMEYTDEQGMPLSVGMKNKVQVIKNENYKKVKRYLQAPPSEHFHLGSDSLLIEYTIITNANSLSSLEFTLKGDDDTAGIKHKIGLFSSIVLISSFNRIEEIQPYTQIEYIDHITEEKRSKRMGPWLKPILETPDVEILEIDH